MSDAERFEELYRQTRRDVLAYLLRRVRDAEDAADLLAEVYVVAWRRRADRPDGDDARPWLFGVARNVLAAHSRKRVRARQAADGLRELLRTAAPEAVPKLPAPDLGPALEALGPLDRELVTLTTWEGLTPAEAGRALGLSPGTARVRLHRARSRLRLLVLTPD